MTPPATTATVTVKPAWINTGFHALFTKPGIEFDGQSHQLRWGTNAVDIPESTERIGVYFHYPLPWLAQPAPRADRKAPRPTGR